MTNELLSSSKKLSFNSTLFKSIIFLLLITGFIFRLLPLFNHQGRLLRQWPTEDGYLMLTIARNIAIGKGMSIADGTIATNGTQPLFNFIEAICFLLVGGNKELGVALVLILHLIISVIATALVFILTKYLLKKRPYSLEIAVLTSALWYSSSVIMPHTMNCLETGLYISLILISVYFWYRQEVENFNDNFSWSTVGIGLLIGITCWARIDAVFLLATITFLHVLLAFIYNKKQLTIRIIESFVIGTTAIITISPWLLYNKLSFGNFTPISGKAQSISASFGSNASELPSTLFEYLTVILPIPHSLEKTIPFLVLSLLTLLIAIAVLIHLASYLNKQELILLYFTVIFSFCFIVYYGFFFGAPHFVQRYLFPISPFFTIFTVTIIFTGLTRFPRIFNQYKIMSIILLFIVTFTIALNSLIYKSGNNHMHFQVVEWVKDNVEDSVWIGAIQTGTLGFFHDRTINLDGKVNPAALNAAVNKQLPEYIVNQEFDSDGNKINYLADWSGIATFMKEVPISNNFELIVNDTQKNLAVLKRKSS